MMKLQRSAVLVFYALICIVASRLAGPPGKKGPAGDRGLPGPRGAVGAPGTCECSGYDEIRTELDVLKGQKIQTDEELENFKDIMNVKLGEVTSRIACLSLDTKIIHGGTCFWAEMSHHWISYSAAEALCLRKNATPANIYSEEHYNKIINYLYSQPSREGSNSEYHTYVWIGMKMNPITNKLTNFDGSDAQYAKWRSGSPDLGSEYRTSTSMVIDLMRDRNSARTGMFNCPAVYHSGGKRGVICEI